MRAITIGFVALCVAGVGVSGCRHKHKKETPVAANTVDSTTTTTTTTTGS